MRLQKCQNVYRFEFSFNPRAWCNSQDPVLVTALRSIKDKCEKEGVRLVDPEVMDILTEWKSINCRKQPGKDWIDQEDRLEKA